MNAISTIPELNAFLAAKAKACAERQAETARLSDLADRLGDDEQDDDINAARLCIAALRAARIHISAISGDVTVLDQIESALDAAGEAV